MAGGVTAGWLYLRSVDRHIERLDVFGGMPPEQRPEKVVEGPLNFLVLGRDTPEDGGTSSRSDSIVLVHIPGNREGVYAISIPRDTWVTVPVDHAGRPDVPAKVNAAFAWGGAALTVRTVERFSGVRIDHVVEVDFAGFARIIDALDGVEVVIERSFVASEPPYRPFVQGLRHLDGASALDYARERHAFPDGDFARIRHQQELIAAMIGKASQRDLLTDPRRLSEFLRATAAAVSLDRGTSLLELGWLAHDLRGARTTMITSPSAGTGRVGDQSVVFADTAGAGRLFEAVRTDRLAGWAASNAAR
ncbi:LCP family protein [Micromonospora sp. WMMD1102]|uniref:LCP family protein n=1 Tax=Micromonospora sp. WMMD1102 TaxID=3016105 RepID=UPI0024158A1C|nr:LCP family protein [Micromonospora sp. WMMD1102]MDG4786338.1 LCP family protein [Micromonospora sp. WMMD1102]